jgi:hypothetical protein
MQHTPPCLIGLGTIRAFVSQGSTKLILPDYGTWRTQQLSGFEQKSEAIAG